MTDTQRITDSMLLTIPVADEFVVWADGHMRNSKTSIKVFHITDPFLGGSRLCQGKLLYSSDSEKRCNQVAEWMREKQTSYLAHPWIVRSLEDWQTLGRVYGAVAQAEEKRNKANQ